MEANVHVMGPLWNYQGRHVKTDVFDQRPIVESRCREEDWHLKVCLKCVSVRERERGREEAWGVIKS